MSEPKTHLRSSSLHRLLLLGAVLAVFWSAPSLAQVSPIPEPVAHRQNPYNDDLANLRLEFDRSSPPRQAALIARAYKLREFVDRAEDVTTWLNSLAGNHRLHPLVRDEALRYLAIIDVHNANFTAAEAKFRSLGLIRDWAVSSPVVAGHAKSGEWQALGAPRPQLWTDLSSYAGSAGQVYAATCVFSDSARTVALRFGSDADLSVSVNGAELFTNTAEAAMAFDQHAVVVQLVPGWNSILLRLTQAGSGSMRFTLRITTPDGGGIPLKSSPGLNRVATARLSPQLSPSAAVQDLVEIAKNEWKADPHSAEKLQTFGLIESERARESALDHLDAAARLAPSANNWLEAANACNDQPCTFRVLTAALREDPKNERATLALADYYTARNQLEKARELLRTAIQLAPDDFVAQERLTELYVSAGLNSLALEQARAIQRRYPSPLWLKEKLAETYYSLSLLDESREILQAVVREDFDNPFVRKLMGDILRRTRDAAGLATLAQNDSRLNPASRHERMGSSAAQPPLEDLDTPYLENAAGLAAAARENPPAADSNAVALSDVRVERVSPNGLSSVRVQQVFYIVTEQGARQYGSQAVQYSPASQQLRTLHARVYKADGSVVGAQDGDDSRVADAAVSMYYDVRSHEVQFPGLEKGDVVELDYSITPTQGSNPYGDYFGNLVVFQTSIPEKLKRYVLISPSDKKLSVVETRMPARANIAERDGTRIYRWEARDLAALPNETRGPSVTEIAPYVHVSTFSSWHDLGRWYAGMIQPQLKTDGQLRDIAAELAAGKKSEFEKINAIYQFVLRNTHYVAFEFGIYSYKPYPVTQIYERRFGDCKDKASLMIALLRQAGIDADFALLRTRRMGEIDPHAASIALFNHAIVYLPKWNMWLDGTADYFTSGELPVEDQGAMALVVAADGGSSLLHVPITRPEDNYTRRTVRAVLANDGSIQFQGENYTRGEDAPGLRRQYELPDRQRDSVRDSLAKVFPSVRVDDVHVQDENGPERFVNVDFRGTIDNFVGQRTVSLPTSWMQQSYVQTLAPSASRDQELVLPAPWTHEEELHFQLPAGVDSVSLPANTDLKTQFGNVHIRYEKHGREIVIRTSLEFSAIRIAPEDYGAFRDFCRSVEQAFRSEVKVSFRG